MNSALTSGVVFQQQMQAQQLAHGGPGAGGMGPGGAMGPLMPHALALGPPNSAASLLALSSGLGPVSAAAAAAAATLKVKERTFRSTRSILCFRVAAFCRMGECLKVAACVETTSGCRSDYFCSVCCFCAIGDVVARQRIGFFDTLLEPDVIELHKPTNRQVIDRPNGGYAVDVEEGKSCFCVLPGFAMLILRLVLNS